MLAFKFLAWNVPACVIIEIEKQRESSELNTYIQLYTDLCSKDHYYSYRLKVLSSELDNAKIGLIPKLFIKEKGEEKSVRRAL
jgi:hypothetical protein